MIHLHHEGPVAVLRMEHGKANALDTELLEGLTSALGEAVQGGAQAVVLTGTGSIFSAGVDLFRVVDDGAGYLDGFLPVISETFQELFTLPLPVVAAVNGHAIAGGAVLAAACDLRIMARGEGRVGVPELRVGVPFPVVPLEILRFAVPPQHLQDLVYRGRTYPAQEALERGLVDELVDAGDLPGRAMDAALALAALPGDAFRLTKEHLRRPAVERMERLAPEIGPRVEEAWSAPETHRRIRAYLEATLGKGSREG